MKSDPANDYILPLVGACLLAWAIYRGWIPFEFVKIMIEDITK